MRALANLLGVSKVTVWKWEKGDSKPRRRLVGPLARALEVSAVQLRLPAELADAVNYDAESGDASIVGVDADVALPGEALADVIERAKRMIADASGVGPRNITISIEY